MKNTNYDRRPTYEAVYNELESVIGPRFNIELIRNTLSYSKQKPQYDNPMLFENCNFDGTVGTMLTGLTANTSQPVSMMVHDQGESQLCWAFATATMLRSSLKVFLRNQVYPYIFNGNHTINEQDNPSKYKELVEFIQFVKAQVDDEKFHRIVKHQLRRIFKYTVK